MKYTIQQIKETTIAAIPDISQIIYQGGKEKTWFFKFVSEFDMDDDLWTALLNAGFDHLTEDREMARRHQTIMAKWVGFDKQ